MRGFASEFEFALHFHNGFLTLTINLGCRCISMQCKCNQQDKLVSGHSISLPCTPRCVSIFFISSSTSTCVYHQICFVHLDIKLSSRLSFPVIHVIVLVFYEFRENKSVTVIPYYEGMLRVVVENMFKNLPTRQPCFAYTCFFNSFELHCFSWI